MADWDANSPRLTENLVGVLRRVRAAAFRRDAPFLEDARVWHRDMMAGLRVPRPSHVGRFRGEAGFETYRVRVGVNKGVAPADVGGTDGYGEAGAAAMTGDWRPTAVLVQRLLAGLSTS